MVRKVAHFSADLKLRGVIEHPIGNFITPLKVKLNTPKGASQ